MFRSKPKEIHVSRINLHYRDFRKTIRYSYYSVKRIFDVKRVAGIYFITKNTTLLTTWKLSSPHTPQKIYDFFWQSFKLPQLKFAMENAQYSVRFLKNSAKIYKETLRRPPKKLFANTKYNSKKYVHFSTHFKPLHSPSNLLRIRENRFTEVFTNLKNYWDAWKLD